MDAKVTKGLENKELFLEQSSFAFIERPNGMQVVRVAFEDFLKIFSKEFGCSEMILISLRPILEEWVSG